ncbi:MAG: hypothetical protein ACRCYS_03245 [Beijerinckiaceae bacterium]
MVAKYLIVFAIASLVIYEQIVQRQLRRRGLAYGSFLASQSAVMVEITRRARAGNVLSQLHHAALLAILLWILVGLGSYLFFGK